MSAKRRRRWHRFEVLSITPVIGVDHEGYYVTRRGAAKRCAFGNMVTGGYIQYGFMALPRRGEQ